jgi:hypothetical protein
MATREFVAIGGVLLAAAAAQGCGSGSGEQVGATSSADAMGPLLRACGVKCDELPPGTDDSHPPGWLALAFAEDPGVTERGAPWVITATRTKGFAAIPTVETATSAASAQFIVSQTLHAGLATTVEGASITPRSSEWTLFSAGVYNKHEIGVRFDGSGWLIYNEDGSAIPSGASFSILASPGLPGDSFTTVQAPKTRSYAVTIPGATDPDDVLIATHVWNPPGASSPVLDDRTLALSYLGGAWSVAHADKSLIPPSAAFNVVSASAFGVPFVGGTVVVANTSNTFGSSVLIGSKRTRGQPDAVLFVSSNLSKGGNLSSCPLAISYDTAAADWAVLCEDGTAMPSGVAFNVLVTHPRCADEVQDGSETDVDCGGANFCARCATKQHCATDGDCQSGQCVVGGAGGFCAP